MNIDNFTSLFFIVAFVIPGFIFNFVHRVFIPVRYEEKEITLLNFITISCVNYGIWSWLIFWIYQSHYYEQHPLRTGFAWLLIVFLSPLFLGVIWGIVRNNRVIEKLFSKVGISMIHPVPTSWDYKFAKIDSPLWVLITLKDKTVVAGYWGNESFASSDPDERDIYIQKVYKISSEKTWQPTPENNDGILISGDQIKTIEFFRN